MTHTHNHREDKRSTVLYVVRKVVTSERARLVQMYTILRVLRGYVIFHYSALRWWLDWKWIMTGRWEIMSLPVHFQVKKPEREGKVNQVCVLTTSSDQTQDMLTKRKFSEKLPVVSCNNEEHLYPEFMHSKCFHRRPSAPLLDQSVMRMQALKCLN